MGFIRKFRSEVICEDFILFTPLDPFETPMAMGNLREEYNRVIGDGKVDPLLVIPIFIHGFCAFIHFWTLCFL